MVSASAATAESDLAAQEIRIGVAGPLTTPSATFGLEMRQAVDLAIDERDAATLFEAKSLLFGPKKRKEGQRR
jgi:ABC-type branched-subunit amino acid transport system substrate-binding protein